MNFVSEKDIEKAKAEQGDNQEEHDPRPLFERLKAARESKQEEFDAEREALKQQRYLDEGEVEFLHSVDKLKWSKELEKKKEENELIEAQKKAMASVEKPTTSTASVNAPKTKAGSLLTNKKEKQMIGIVRKRKHSEGSDEPKDTVVPEKACGLLERAGGYPTTLINAASLPGVGMYESSSDSSDDELGSPSIMSAVNPISSTKSVKSGSSTSLNSSTA